MHFACSSLSVQMRCTNHPNLLLSVFYVWLGSKCTHAYIHASDSIPCHCLLQEREIENKINENFYSVSMLKTDAQLYYSSN